MLVLLSLACTPRPTVPVGPPPLEPAAVILFVRHAEKAKDGTPDPPLTEAGEARARCLAERMRPTNPKRLLTTEYQRTRSTLAPTAATFGIDPVVLPADDSAKWIEALQQSKPGTVTLVAGHSNTIPELVKELGGSLFDLDDKGHIPSSEYNRLVTVTLDSEGRATSTFTQNYCVPPPDAG